MSHIPFHRFETLQLHAGQETADPATDARAVPIYQTTSYVFHNAAHAAARFHLEEPGNIYGRLTNSTQDVLEKRVAALEGGVAAVAVSAGQTASMLAILNIARAGDHIVAVASLYGGTVSLFTNTFSKLGIEFTFVQPDADSETVRKAIRPNTKAIFAETLANPALIVLDIERFAGIAHEAGIPLIVDNTFPTAYLCRPFDFGADIVTHSTSKYTDGHAMAIGGIVIEKGNFNWSNGKFPDFTEPDPAYHGLVYMENFKAAPFSVKLRVQFIRDMGVPMAPFNALLANLGLETLHIRMQRHCENAMAMAEFLENHPKVSWVNYPGLKSSSQYELAKKYMPKGCSGVICFGVKGGKAAGERVMNSLKLAAIVVHVADVRTCVLHPASMTHRQLSDAELKAAGVSPDMIRLSVGIENIDDIKADFDQALANA